MLDRLKSVLSPLFAATVIVPTLIALAYFGLLANDVYISESRFVVRSPSEKETSPISAVLGQTGLSSGFVEGNDTITAFRVGESTGRLYLIEVEPVRGSWPRFAL